MRRAIAVVLVLSVLAVPDRASGALGDADVVLTRIATLDSPIAMATRPADAGIYIAERPGVVRRLENGQTTKLLDISEKVTSAGEQGLLGLTFSPSGDAMFVAFTDRNGALTVKRFGFPVGGKLKKKSGRNIIKIPHPGDTTHNGGNIAFGPDGHLYIGTGDGGGGGDPDENAQNVKSLLGKMLRIDPKRRGGYTVPGSNPFVGTSARPEIWAFGLRNPWRWSFDRATGDLWIGDVGQNAFEEIDFQPASALGGENYGWDVMEGNHLFEGTEPPPGHQPPIHEYPHSGGRCAVTGGYVYRGSNIPDLSGAYLFADFCTGDVEAFTGDPTDLRSLGVSAPSLASFGQDSEGELYVLSLGGGVFRIDPAA